MFGWEIVLIEFFSTMKKILWMKYKTHLKGVSSLLSQMIVLVQCFEVAVKKEQEEALTWQLFGTIQAESDQVMLKSTNIALT